MCHQCNYVELFNRSRLETTRNRLRVLSIIGDNAYPLSATDIIEVMQREMSINRVTVYRILDLLVSYGLVERLSTGGPAFYYGMAPNENHPRHPHFYCKNCGQMECLDTRILPIDSERFQKNFAGRIDKVEIRMDGMCKNCMRSNASPRH